jgi:hypothetical protein
LRHVSYQTEYAVSRNWAANQRIVSDITPTATSANRFLDEKVSRSGAWPLWQVNVAHPGCARNKDNIMTSNNARGRRPRIMAGAVLVAVGATVASLFGTIAQANAADLYVVVAVGLATEDRSGRTAIPELERDHHLRQRHQHSGHDVLLSKPTGHRLTL